MYKTRLRPSECVSIGGENPLAVNEPNELSEGSCNYSGCQPNLVQSLLWIAWLMWVGARGKGSSQPFPVDELTIVAQLVVC